jgi:hypothetical protein
MKVAALFVANPGVYFGLPVVDPWDVERDARKYDGPWPVVAHPPCERWGRYWGGGPSAKTPRKLGDDDGCFASALMSVRRFGGVLEHPEASHAFARFGLGRPRWRAGWQASDDGSGWVCCVAQGNYGHRARKLTWLFYCPLPSTLPPELNWTIPAPRSRLDYGFHSAEERRLRGHLVTPKVKPTRLRTGENLATPLAFRDLLIDLARRSTGTAKAAE